MTHGMVAAPQPEAVEAGALALKRGGNAMDAAVACALVQGVVDPVMTGIAGVGAAQVLYPREGLHACFNFLGHVPAGARADMWADLVESENADGYGFKLKWQGSTRWVIKASSPPAICSPTIDWPSVLVPLTGSIWSPPRSSMRSAAG